MDEKPCANMLFRAWYNSNRFADDQFNDAIKKQVVANDGDKIYLSQSGSVFL